MLLALDLATTIGFARGLPGQTPVHGTHRLPKTDDDVGAFLIAYEDWLTDHLSQHRVTHVIFESPILRKLTNIYTLRKLYGLAGETERICGRSQTRCSEEDMQRVRKRFIGVTQAPKTITGQNERRKWLKATIIAECNRRGWNPADDNAADALAIWDFSAAHISHAHAAATSGPLFPQPVAI